MSAGGFSWPSWTSCRKLNSLPSSCVMKTSFCSTSGAAAFVLPMLMRSGFARIDPASSHTAGGSVAENMRVCKRPPLSSFGQNDRISSIWGAKPRSKSLSASSKTMCLVASKEILSSRNICARRRGVAMATSSLLMFLALSPDSRSSKRPDHFLPAVSFTNSSKVCFASSREGSMTTARANSFPGFVSRARRGPRNAMVLPLPVGADARTWPPASTAGKHCIWMGVGCSKPRLRRFATSQGGTPRSRMASKDSTGSGAPALAWMRRRRRSAAAASRPAAAARPALPARGAAALSGPSLMGSLPPTTPRSPCAVAPPLGRLAGGAVEEEEGEEEEERLVTGGPSPAP
mmetsp:Transcript_5093/g.16079  ORF Transcript_5093/g.16079 Transcript_5093/m.16079 type:complete len:346 (-) Transcript_5093:201-1238(-)